MIWSTVPPLACVGGRKLGGKAKPLRAGKLDLDVLRSLLETHTLVDSQVVVGPKVGEDAAVIDVGTDRYWVVASDPVTFTSEEIGYYGVVVNLNDIATRGAIPRWFLATLLFPEDSVIGDVETVFSQIHKACQRFQVSFVGGHTEITPGIERVILSGHMIGEVEKERLVTTSGARAGDLLLLVKGVCIEGTSIMAREKESELLAHGIEPPTIQKARNFIFDPGIEILRAARIACDSAFVHSMHDPTEGGLVNGIVEIALASEKEIQVDLENIYIYEESRAFCKAFDLDPLGVIASGALLVTISPGDLAAIEGALGEGAIPVQVIGQVMKGPARVLAKQKGGLKELEPFSRDEILKIFET